MTYMRFISTDARSTSFDDLEQALREIAPNSLLRRMQIGDYADAEIDEAIHAEVEINRRGDELFAEEIDELREPVEWFSDTPPRQQVLNALDNAREIVCFRLTRAGWEADFMDRLCDWLLANRQGLLQIDGEGYFDATNSVLKM